MSNFKNKSASTAPSTPQVGLLRSSIVVGIMTMLSRVLGLIRDIVVASYFGSTASADAFFVAFKIPNFLRRLFAEGAFSQAFVPILSEYRTTRCFADVRELVSRVSGTLTATLIFVTIAGVLAAPLLIRLFAPGFIDDPDKLKLASDMLRITFPYLLLISLTALAGSVLNTYGKFAIPAFTPVLLNMSLIGSTVLFSPLFHEPVMALAWGVTIAGISQLIFQIPFLFQIRLLPLPKWGVKHTGSQRIMKLMIPALFGVSVSQINLLLDTVLASFLQTGSVSWLYYSDRLSELPLGVFGIAIATVILPNLSIQSSKTNDQHFSNTIDWALRLVLLIGFPAATALYILAKPLIITLFYYGEMTEYDVIMSAKSLAAYAPGLIAFMIIKVLAPAYFARQNTSTPVKIAIKSMIINMILNLVFIVPFQHAGLALATSLSSFLNAILLFRGLRKTNVHQPKKGWLLYLIRILTANLVMSSLLLWLVADAIDWLHWSTTERLINTLRIVLIGITTYGITLLLTGLRFNDIRH